MVVAGIDHRVVEDRKSFVRARVFADVFVADEHVLIVFRWWHFIIVGEAFAGLTRFFRGDR